MPSVADSASMHPVAHCRRGGMPSPPSAYVYGRRPREGWLLRSAAAAAAAVASGLLIGALVRGKRRSHRGQRATSAVAREASTALRDGAAVLAGSVLVDSALEHYRAEFEHRAMYIAPSVAAATLASLPRGAAARGWQHAVLWTAVATGIAGSGFHLTNLLKRPSALRRADGSFSWLGLFYAAPLGAPIAMTLSGLLGLSSDQIASRDPSESGGSASTLLDASADRALSVGTSVALLGTSLEVWNLHFRGAFQNPFMYVPVAVPPAAALALLGSAINRGRKLQGIARTLLRATAAVGLAGVGFHAYGIRRNMGGFRNWSQMILQGPPVPAPPAFTGLALAGLGALQLMEQHHG